MTLDFLKERRIRTFIVSFLSIILFIWILVPPASFPIGSIITVQDGTGLYALANNLKEDKVIRSPFWFRIFAMTFGGERAMKAGQYYMEGPENTFMVAWRVFHGDYRIETIRITIPEGFTVKKISNLFDERFPFFDKVAFEAYAREGYLFPDTYFVPVTATASSTLKMFSDNFDRKIATMASDLEKSDKSLDEIITMASILEGESSDHENMRIVSGILWKRLEIGMALQVDAGFVYVNGKTTKDLTAEDLKIKSPFNTYINRGLPPTPISNPGLDSIKAALYPQKTPYLYFLTSDDGEMHYSKTFEEHVENKFKYIKQS